MGTVATVCGSAAVDHTTQINSGNQEDFFVTAADDWPGSDDPNVSPYEANWIGVRDKTTKGAPRILKTRSTIFQATVPGILGALSAPPGDA